MPSYYNRRKINYQWRPIETGPKDGSEILVSGFDHGKGPTRYYVIARWKEGKGRWPDHYADQSGAMYLCYLTHWMPIPPVEGNALSISQSTFEPNGITCRHGQESGTCDSCDAPYL